MGDVSLLEKKKKPNQNVVLLEFGLEFFLYLLIDFLEGEKIIPEVPFCPTRCLDVRRH